MGVLTDFVVAPAGSGAAIGQALHPADQWPTLEAKGVDTIKFATLYCSVSGFSYNNAVHNQLELCGGNKDQGPWVFSIPPDFLQAIAGIPDSEILPVAKRWMQTDELAADGWKQEDAAEFISLLRNHATQALAKDQSMFLWLSI